MLYCSDPSVVILSHRLVVISHRSCIMRCMRTVIQMMCGDFEVEFPFPFSHYDDDDNYLQNDLC